MGTGREVGRQEGEGGTGGEKRDREEKGGSGEVREFKSLRSLSGSCAISPLYKMCSNKVKCQHLL